MTSATCAVCGVDERETEMADPAAEGNGLMPAPLPLCETCQDYLEGPAPEDEDEEEDRCMVCGTADSTGYFELEGEGPAGYEAFYSGSICDSCSSQFFTQLLDSAHRFSAQTD